MKAVLFVLLGQGIRRSSLFQSHVGLYHPMFRMGYVRIAVLVLAFIGRLLSVSDGPNLDLDVLSLVWLLLSFFPSTVKRWWFLVGIHALEGLVGQVEIIVGLVAMIPCLYNAHGKARYRTSHKEIGFHGQFVIQEGSGNTRTVLGMPRGVGQLANAGFVHTNRSIPQSLTSDLIEHGQVLPCQGIRIIRVRFGLFEEFAIQDNQQMVMGWSRKMGHQRRQNLLETPFFLVQTLRMILHIRFNPSMQTHIAPSCW